MPVINFCMGEVRLGLSHKRLIDCLWAWAVFTCVRTWAYDGQLLYMMESEGSLLKICRASITGV